MTNGSPSSMPGSRGLRVTKFILSVLALALASLIAASVFFFTVSFVPASDPIKLTAGIAGAIVIGGLLLWGWQRIFRWSIVPSRIVRVVALALAIAVPGYVIAIPIDVPPLAALPLKPELITVDKSGNKVAVYTYKAAHPVTDTPIVFEVGGPGGAMRPDILNFLKSFADRGIDAVAYDPLGSGQSPDAKDVVADYTMEGEVDRLNAVVAHTGAKQVVLMAQSFGGNIAARYITRYPQKVAKYIALDTAPIYDFFGNTPAESKQVVKSLGNTLNRGAGPEVKSKFDWRAQSRIEQGVGFLSLFGRLPWGTSAEYNYYTWANDPHEPAPKGQDPLLPDATAPTATYGGFIPLIQLNKAIMTSPDFTAQLKKVGKSVPVLVFHPEFGIVDWDIQWGYQDYFDSVSYIPVPGAPHRVWNTERGRELVVKDSTKFIVGEDVSADTWKDSADPYPGN